MKAASSPATARSTTGSASRGGHRALRFGVGSGRPGRGRGRRARRSDRRAARSAPRAAAVASPRRRPARRPARPAPRRPRRRPRPSGSRPRRARRRGRRPSDTAACASTACVADTVSTTAPRRAMSSSTRSSSPAENSTTRAATVGSAQGAGQCTRARRPRGEAGAARRRRSGAHRSGVDRGKPWHDPRAGTPGEGKGRSCMAAVHRLHHRRAARPGDDGRHGRRVAALHDIRGERQGARAPTCPGRDRAAASAGVRGGGRGAELRPGRDPAVRVPARAEPADPRAWNGWSAATCCAAPRTGSS